MVQLHKKAIAFSIPREQAFLSATQITAKELDCETAIGSISVGKGADFAVCDEKMRLYKVYMDGRRINS